MLYTDCIGGCNRGRQRHRSSDAVDEPHRPDAGVAHRDAGVPAETRQATGGSEFLASEPARPRSRDLLRVGEAGGQQRVGAYRENRGGDRVRVKRDTGIVSKLGTPIPAGSGAREARFPPRLQAIEIQANRRTAEQRAAVAEGVRTGREKLTFWLECCLQVEVLSQGVSHELRAPLQKLDRIGQRLIADSQSRRAKRRRGERAKQLVFGRDRRGKSCLRRLAVQGDLEG